MSSLKADQVGSETNQAAGPVLADHPVIEPMPSCPQMWQSPSIQKCDDHLACISSDPITAATATTPAAHATLMAVMQARQNWHLHRDRRCRGKNLTTSSFVNAGYRLRNFTVPGLHAPVSFGPGRPVYLMTLHSHLGQLVIANESAAG